jgi:hypothetical protein
MIDRTSLSEVMEMLGEICYGKAEHLEIDWRDKAAAEDWRFNAGKIEELQENLLTV